MRNFQILNLFKKNKKVFIFLSLFFIVPIFLGFFYFWQVGQDHLIKFAPINTVLYIHLQKPFGFWSQEKLTDLPLFQFYQKIGQLLNFKNSDFQKLFLANSSEMAFLLLPNQDESELFSVVILKFKNKRLIPSQLLRNSKNIFLREKFLVLSNSPQALKIIEETSKGSLFSLNTKIKTKNSPFNLLSLYLATDQLSSYLDPFDPISKILISFFEKQRIDNLFFNLKKSKNFFRFVVFTNQSKVIFPNFRKTTDLDFLFWPPSDFIFFTSFVTLSDILAVWQATDKNLVDFQQIFNSYKKIYNIDLLPLLERKSSFIISQNENNSSKIDFYFLFPLKEDKELETWEKAIRVILANQFPQEIEKKLPDKSLVMELVANPEIFNFQKQELKPNLIANHLILSDLDFEFVYLVLDDKLILGNSLDLIGKVINNPDASLKTLVSSCFKTVPPFFFAINPKNFLQSESFWSYLPWGPILITSQKNNILLGCF